MGRGSRHGRTSTNIVLLYTFNFSAFVFNYPNQANIHDIKSCLDEFHGCHIHTLFFGYGWGLKGWRDTSLFCLFDRSSKCYKFWSIASEIHLLISGFYSLQVQKSERGCKCRSRWNSFCNACTPTPSNPSDSFPLLKLQVWPHCTRVWHWRHWILFAVVSLMVLDENQLKFQYFLQNQCFLHWFFTLRIYLFMNEL